MIPAVPLIPPPSFEQAALPPPVVPPAFDPESEVLLPPPVEPPLSGEFDVVPGPASVRPAPVEPEQATPPLLNMLGQQPAPAEGSDVTIAQGWDRVRTLGQERVSAQREAASAAEELRAAAAEFESAQTPAQQRAAMKRAESAQQRMQRAQAVGQAAGLAQEREEAAQAAEIESTLTAERTARYQEAAELLDARAADTESRVAELQAERQRAQERRAMREQEYASLLDRGPQDQAATWTAAVGMIGEMWSAFAQRRQPNLATWLDRGLQQAREKHASELDALKVRIGTEERAAEDAAVEVAQAKADDLAFEQAYLARLDRDLGLLAAQYGQTPRGMAADQARRQVAAQQQARAAEANAAYEKAERERNKAAAELRKLGLESDLLAKKLRGGAGAGKAQFGQREDIPENALVDPVTGQVLGVSRFDTPKDVRADQDTIRGMSDMLSEMQEYVNLLANTGRVYQGLGAKFVKDADRARLEAKHGKLLSDIIRAYSGAAATDAEVARLKQVLPPPKAYTDMGSWDPAQVVRDYRDTHSRIYENFLISRLETGGTMIRGPKGETLSTSPTFGWRSERGDAPVRTIVGDIVVDLNQDSDQVFNDRLAAWVNAAAGAGKTKQAQIADGMRSALDALKETRQTQRAKVVREALRQVEAGETRRSEVFPPSVTEPDVRVRHASGATIKIPQSKVADAEAEGWEVVE